MQNSRPSCAPRLVSDQTWPCYLASELASRWMDHQALALACFLTAMLRNHSLSWLPATCAKLKLGTKQYVYAETDAGAENTFGGSVPKHAAVNSINLPSVLMPHCLQQDATWIELQSQCFAGSECHFAVLTNDGFWRLYHTDDLTVAEQTFELHMKPHRCAPPACHCSAADSACWTKTGAADSDFL